MILEEMNEKGFVFLKYTPHVELLEEMKAFNKLQLASHEESEGYGGMTWEPPIEKHIPKTVAYFKSFLAKHDLMQPYLHFDLERITKGQYHALHAHFLPANYQICIWFPFDEFEGREFVYGTRSNLKHFKPSFGDLVLFKPNDASFVHGTTPLLTDTIVYSLGITSSQTPKINISKDLFV